MQKYIITALAIFLISCTNNENRSSHFTEEEIKSLSLDSTTILTIDTDSLEVINLNPFLKKQHFDLGSLVEDIKLVALETTDESLLDIIYKILVTDSHIYIHDRLKGGGLVVFDRNGKFIRRIPYGQGPGELSRMYDVSFDSENNELIVYVHSFLLFFTPDGEFIKQKRLPFGFYNFEAVSDGYVFRTLDRQGNEHLENWKDYTLLKTDKNFKLESVGLFYLPNEINYGGYHYLYKNNHTLDITQKFGDTIYQYVDKTNRLRAKYTLDFHEKELPEHYLKGTSNAFFDAIGQHDYYYFLGEYLDTSSHHLFVLMNDHINLKTLIYRDKKSGNMIGGTYAKYDDINEIPSIAIPWAASGNYFVSLHTPGKTDSSLYKSSILSDTDKEILKNTSEDDNPMLVFFKLKNF